MTTRTEPDCTTFERLLAEKGTLVADGAMGTTLFEMGLESGSCPELLNVEDLPIPGVAYGFRGLLDAQAEGDLEALRARRRPIIRP